MAFIILAFWSPCQAVIRHCLSISFAIYRCLRFLATTSPSEMARRLHLSVATPLFPHSPPFQTIRAQRRSLRQHFAVPFDVTLCSARLGNSTFSLNRVHVPVVHCPPEVQRHLRLHRLYSPPAERLRFKLPSFKRLLWCLMILSVFALLLPSSRPTTVSAVGCVLLTTASIQPPRPTYYACPGSSFALVENPSANLPQFCQSLLSSRLIRAVVQANDRNLPDIGNNIALVSNDSAENNEPRGFTIDADQSAIALDTGANRIIVNDKSLLRDFKASEGGIKGLGGSPVASSGTGTYRLRLQSDDGHVETFDLPGAMHCPTSPYNLLPPQLLVKILRTSYSRNVRISHDDTQLAINWTDEQAQERVTTVATSANGLFLIQSPQGYFSFFRAATKYVPSWSSFAGSVAVIHDEDSVTFQPQEAVDQRNPNTTDKSTPAPNAIEHEDSDFAPIRDRPIGSNFERPEADSTDKRPGHSPDLQPVLNKQARLMTVHETLGHLSFATLKLMARANLISRDLSNVTPPVCPGCAYGKAHRKAWRSKGHRNSRKIKPATAPGQVVSVDQLVSPTPGFIPTHRGTPTTSRYLGATVFVDHFSDFTYVHLMSKMDAAATVEAKRAFERVANQYGIRIKHYHADNGLFDTKLFKASVDVAGQTLSFCGVNAHHQNGIAERRIRDVTEGARTALLHAAHRWPAAVNSSLWPSALKHYVNIRNCIPRKFVPEQKIGRKLSAAQFHGSPLSKFSSTIIEPNLKHFHPFGAPVYVLSEALQARKSHNKWTDRTRVGIFLCHSPHHASDVPLVLNTQTGLVSPQYHVIYDDAFDTVRRDARFRSLWQSKAKLQAAASLDTTADASVTQPSSSKADTPSTSRVPTVTQLRTIPSVLQTPWTIEIPNSAASEGVDGDVSRITDEQTAHVEDERSVMDTVIEADQESERESDPGHNEASEPTSNTDQGIVTRAGRTSRPNVSRYDPRIYAMSAFVNTFYPSTRSSQVDREMLQEDLPADDVHPFAAVSQVIYGLAASQDPDTMTIEEALAQPDREQFILAMKKELNDHINRHHWTVIPRSEVPGDRHLIPMVWSMKRKRNPIGEITKWKARLCAGGHKQIHGLDYWSTYSPVVAWSTAPASMDTYMKPPKVPKGFKIPDLSAPNDVFTKAYKLLRNLYGLKDAGRTWYLHLTAGLLKRGWKQSEVDTCLFTKGDVILILYVDDAILTSPNSEHIDDAISSLQEEFDLTDDGELHDYLGTRFERHKDGSIELTQPRMISRILDYVGLDPKDERVKLHDSPAASGVLHRDISGPSRKQSWNYRGVVGCLSYLQAMVRPDITFAVQQCARFSNDPKQCHEEAVKRICRYVLRTKDKGLHLRPDPSKGLECFVDADWAGSWHHDNAEDPNSAHSRSGYVLMYAGCPILWTSKLQKLIALSTTEAEYIALSSALREVIGVMGLLTELRKSGFPIPFPTPVITCKVFEDNRSCIEIATNHKTRPRTKHLSIRLHHFRSYVQAKLITIRHVGTTEQTADIFTKALPTPQFKYLRNKLMGWNPSSREGV